MSYAVVHMQKVNAGGIRGIQSHVNREHPPKTNPDIDPERSRDNYAFVESRNFYRDAMRIVRENAPKTKTVRKDAVLLCNFVVTSDHEFFQRLPRNQQRALFRDALDWFGNRYGKNLIASAVIHMDESTPHMHLSVVPIKDGRLAAKNLFTKSELRDLQTAFARDVGAKYGLQRGVEGSNRHHLTELQFKIRSSEKALERASERVAELAKEARIQEAMASEAEKRLSKVRNEAAGVNTEYLAKRAYLAACDASSAVSVMYPDYAVVKKSLFGKETVTVPKEKWEERHVSANEKSALRRAVRQFEGAVDDFRQRTSGQYVTDLEKQVEELSSENTALLHENRSLQALVRQKDHQAERAMDALYDKLDAVLDKLPAAAAEQFVQEWDANEMREKPEMDLGPEL